MGLQTNKKVIVFVKNGCKACHGFTTWLDKIHLKYESKVITEHKELWEEVKKLGAVAGKPFTTIPTIMIEDGEDRVYFNMSRDFKTYEQGRHLISNEIMKGIGGKKE
tara:strand:- start:2010 stop:2330 length:321 start_codon:yes stop_codon:yes gene_type:complete